MEGFKPYLGNRGILINCLTQFEEVSWSQQWDRCRGKLSGQ